MRLDQYLCLRMCDTHRAIDYQFGAFLRSGSIKYCLLFHSLDLVMLKISGSWLTKSLGFLLIVDFEIVRVYCVPKKGLR